MIEGFIKHKKINRLKILKNSIKLKI